jgi:hypothetical protein
VDSEIKIKSRIKSRIYLVPLPLSYSRVEFLLISPMNIRTNIRQALASGPALNLDPAPDPSLHLHRIEPTFVRHGHEVLLLILILLLIIVFNFISVSFFDVPTGE